MEILDKLAPPAPPPPCCNNKDISAAVAKGKRTKRQRPHSPPSIPFTIITPTAGEYQATTTTYSDASSSSEESTTTEEEDTARCLILLARGHNFSIHVNHDPDLKQHSGSKIRHAETAAAGGGACTYACKTCDRVFPSFQALGGHRASHKKPKNDKRPLFFSDHEEDNFRPSKKLKMPPSSFSLQLSNIPTGSAAAVPRTHECAYCGAEFASGQALGGHMRRHRAEPEAKKSRNVLSLDLNLPAPEDENQRLGIAGRQQKSPEMLALSATTQTLVDCPY